VQGYTLIAGSSQKTISHLLSPFLLRSARDGGLLTGNVWL
jgi:hypothetical protein